MPSLSPSPNASSSRSSATPPPIVVEKKKKPRDKGKKKANVVVTTHGRNEGTDPNWDYKPPLGAVLLEDKDADAGEFDWDAINDDDDLELCLVRIPEVIKPKHLDKLKVDLPASSGHSACVGTLKRKVATFDIWSIGSDVDKQMELPIGGEEVKSISCLLPRKSKEGKLYPAPKPITHYLVLAAQPVLPTPPETEADESDGGIIEYKNPPRHSYPKEALKHRFMPTGSQTRAEGEDNGADETADVSMTGVETPLVEEDQIAGKPPSVRRKEKKGKGKQVDEVVNEQSEPEKKGKKRKPEAIAILDTPTKKSKRSKSS